MNRTDVLYWVGCQCFEGGGWTGTMTRRGGSHKMNERWWRYWRYTVEQTLLTWMRLVPELRSPITASEVIWAPAASKRVERNSKVHHAHGGLTHAMAWQCVGSVGQTPRCTMTLNALYPLRFHLSQRIRINGYDLTWVRTTKLTVSACGFYIASSFLLLMLDQTSGR